MADTKKDAGPAAWGGIGGSGKHAADMVADLLADKRFQDFSKSDAGQMAWGGIGGSGKHAEEMEAEKKR